MWGGVLRGYGVSLLGWVLKMDFLTGRRKIFSSLLFPSFFFVPTFFVPHTLHTLHLLSTPSALQYCLSWHRRTIVMAAAGQIVLLIPQADQDQTVSGKALWILQSYNNSTTTASNHNCLEGTLPAIVSSLVYPAYILTMMTWPCLLDPNSPMLSYQTKQKTTN